MAIFRKIHTSFWSDSFISELDADQKLFYIYLMTNERTRQCGVYEITKKQISFDLGYSMDKVSKLLQYFIKKGKIRYNEETKEMALGNWLKYNSSTSPKVKSCISKEFGLVKDTVLIEYVKSMDTQSQEEEEEEEEEEEQEEQEEEKDSFKNDKFVRLEFSEAYTKWMKYKSERKQKYASESTRKQFYESLLELSENNSNIAMQIVNQSISNNYSGIFKLKTQNNEKPKSKYGYGNNQPTV